MEESEEQEILSSRLSYRELPLKVHDIMSIEEISVYQDDPVKSALRIMQWEGLKHACVFDEQNEIVGTLHLDEVLKKENQNKIVKEIMHKDFHMIYGALDSEAGKKAVLREKDHCLPVFENKKIIGILNAEDLFETYSNH